MDYIDAINVDGVPYLVKDKFAAHTAELSLGFGQDGKLYIFVSGVAIGTGVTISGSIATDDITVVDNVMTIRGLANTPVQSGNTLIIS